MISDEILTIIDLFFLHRKPGLYSCTGKHFLLRSYSKGLVLPNGSLLDKRNISWCWCAASELNGLHIHFSGGERYSTA